DRYVGNEKKIPIEGLVRVRAGSALSLKVTARGEEYACVFDQKAQKASARPLSDQRIRAQIEKTGETDFYFEKLSVDTDGVSFVPMGALNQLRRAALSALREKLLAPFRRTYTGEKAGDDRTSEKALSGSFRIHGEELPEPVNKKAAVRNDAASGEKRKSGSSIFARVSTDEQLAAVLGNSDITGIYVDSAMLFDASRKSETAAVRAETYIERIARAGKEPWIALPYVERNGECGWLYDRASGLIKAGMKGFLAGSFESTSALIERGLARYVRTDAGIYTWNTEAKRFIRDAGILFDTVPVELNRREIASRDNSGSECIVYGHLPLMITAQCLKKNTSGCDKRSSRLVLMDRRRRKFPVKCECVFCYNILYNPVRLSLLAEADSLGRAGIDSVRLVFTTESGEETDAIIRKAVMAYKDRIPVEIEGEYTKGQFNRGVE
ncbi:MAG: DUF3656 domain-containing protein, partial [Lachnospiraceae bacterium]|nr:DUF3656 domain-containing protein [Lachnospiraceae bacterium]